MSALNGLQTARTRRTIYRGKAFTKTLTDAQKKAISDGTFEDLYIGDTWHINGRMWTIVDFDYWYRSGDIECTKHHIVVMPAYALYNHVMNDEPTTNGGYVNSKMYISGLDRAMEMIKTDFGDITLLNHRVYLPNAAEDGKETAAGWFNVEMEIPNEIMMCGAYIRRSVNGNGSHIPAITTLAGGQLALMQQAPLMINPNRLNFWLRDVVSSTAFSMINAGRSLAYGNANASNYGVRPVFGITGD